MRRRDYVKGAGAAGLGFLSGCSGVIDSVDRAASGVEFDFPSGYSANGIEKNSEAFDSHRQATEIRAYTSEFVRDSTASHESRQTVRSGCTGSDGTQQWVIDSDKSSFTNLYSGPDMLYTGVEADYDQPGLLEIGGRTQEDTFEADISDALRYLTFEALRHPFGEGSVTVQDDGDVPVAVYSVEEPPTEQYHSVESMELAVDIRGIIRNIDIRYALRSAPEIDELFQYTIDLETPPEELTTPPSVLEQHPQPSTEWLGGGTILKVTNEGGLRGMGGPDEGEVTDLQGFRLLGAAVDGAEVGAAEWRARNGDDTIGSGSEDQEVPFQPREAWYVYGAGPLNISASPPGNEDLPQLRGDNPMALGVFTEDYEMYYHLNNTEK